MGFYAITDARTERSRQITNHPDSGPDTLDLEEGNGTTTIQAYRSRGGIKVGCTWVSDSAFEKLIRIFQAK